MARARWADTCIHCKVPRQGSMEWREGFSILGAQGVKAEPCWMIPVEYKQTVFVDPHIKDK